MNRDNPGQKPQGRTPEPARSEGAADLVRQIQEKAAADLEDSDPHMGPSKRRRFWIGFLGLAAAVAVALVVAPYLSGPEGTQIESPPAELMGTWSTNEPRYADRRITINPDQLVMDLGPEGRRVYSIESIFVEVAEVHRMYTLNYSDDEGEQSMDVFVYDDGLLRLRNPSEVRWTRTTR